MALFTKACKFAIEEKPLVASVRRNVVNNSCRFCPALLEAEFAKRLGLQLLVP